MPKFITITLNTSIDRFLEIPNFKSGEVHTPRRIEKYAAGKGVNVSRALSKLGEQVVALGVVGRGDARFFADISSPQLITQWTMIDAPTRSNLTISDPVLHTETHIRMGCNPVDEQAMSDLRVKLRKYCHAGDWVILSGSLPQTLPLSTDYSLALQAKDLGAKVAIDTSNEALKQALKAKPDLIKPNIKELGAIYPTKDHSSKGVAETASKIAHEHEIEWVCISLGKEGCVLYHLTEERALWANIELDNHQPLHSVGSGDAMVGGLCSAIMEGEKMEGVIRRGIASGVANLFTEGPGEISRYDVNRLESQVRVVEIAIKHDK